MSLSKTGMTLLALMAAPMAGGSAYAATVTAFSANFEGSASTTEFVSLSATTDPTTPPNSLATAANLDDGTSVGSWAVTTREESYIYAHSSAANQPVQNQVLRASIGTYSLDTQLAQSVFLDGGTVAFSVAHLKNASNNSADLYISGYQQGVGALPDTELFRIGVSATNNQNQLFYDNGTKQLLGAAGDVTKLYQYFLKTALTDVTLTLSATTMDVAIDGTTVAGGNDISYRGAGTQLDYVRLHGAGTNSAGYFDDIIVTGTAVPEPAMAFGLVGLGAMVLLQRQRRC